VYSWRLNIDKKANEILWNIDYVVNLQKSKKSAKPSAIIKLSIDGKVKVIRK